MILAERGNPKHGITADLTQASAKRIVNAVADLTRGVFFHIREYATGIVASYIIIHGVSPYGSNTNEDATGSGKDSGLIRASPRARFRLLVYG